MGQRVDKDEKLEIENDKVYVDRRKTVPTIDEINNLKRTAKSKLIIIVVIIGNKNISKDQFDQYIKRGPGVYIHK